MRSTVVSVDWNCLLKCSNINVSVDPFYDNIFMITDSQFPKKYFYSSKYLLRFSTTLMQPLF